MSDRLEATKQHRAKVKAELRKTKSGDKAYDPSEVVSWASQHPKSELHRMLEWDNSKAGQEYRLFQARNIIKIYLKVEIIGGIETVNIFSVPSLRKKDGGSYVDRDVVVQQQVYRDGILNEVKAKLISTREDYLTLLPELNPVWAAIKKCCL